MIDFLFKLEMLAKRYVASGFFQFLTSKNLHFSTNLDTIWDPR